MPSPSSAAPFKWVIAPWVAALMVLVVGTLACALLWHQQRSTIQTLAQERFERQAQAFADPAVIKFMDGKEVRKAIYVPGKLLNLVVA